MGYYRGWKAQGLQCSFLRDTMNYEDDDGHTFEYEDDIRGLLRLLMNSFRHSAKSHYRLAIYLIMNEFRRFLSDLQRALHQGGYLSHLCELQCVKASYILLLHTVRFRHLIEDPRKLCTSTCV